MTESKLWHGKSVYQITSNLEAASRTARARMEVERALNAQIEASERAAAEALCRLIEAKPEALRPGDVYFGGHDCPESPTKRCVYDIADDPWKDDCLFCHDPSDRG